MDQAGMLAAGGSDQYATLQWLGLDFPTEEDALDWLENQKRVPPSDRSKGGRLRRGRSGHGSAPSGLMARSGLWAA